MQFRKGKNDSGKVCISKTYTNYGKVKLTINKMMSKRNINTYKLSVLTGINWRIVFAWIIGIIGALVMGFGMSKIMTGDPTQADMMLGIATGIICLIVCVLDYPIYSYLSSNKK